IAPQTPRLDLWYGFAPLKTERLDYVVQKATEMGVGTMQPVLTRFTQVSRVKHDKLLADAIEAAEQCEVLNVRHVAPEVTLHHLPDRWAADHSGRRPGSAAEREPSTSGLVTPKSLARQPVGLRVRPEGGCADAGRERLPALDCVVPIS